MKLLFILPLAAVLTLSTSSLFAQTRLASQAQAIPVEHVAIKASQLYQGMTQADVEKIMGKPSHIKVFPNPDFPLRILSYFGEPIITRVSLIDERLTGITTEAKTVTDNSYIAPFARTVEIGMSRDELVKRLGQPFTSEPTQISSTKFERLTFRKDNQQSTILLQDDRVESVDRRFEFTPLVLSLVLPKEPPMPQNTAPSERIRIGMSPNQVMSIFGKPVSIQSSELDDQKVTDWVYSSLKTNASTRFTFINNVLTRFSFIPQSASPTSSH